MSKKRIRAVRFGSHTLGWRWELPATAEAYAQMLDQAEMAHMRWLDDGDDDRSIYEVVASSWGITPPKKGRK